MTDWEIRARGVAASHGSLVVVALLAVALVGGYLTYTAYVAPGTHTEDRPGPSWETTAAFDHAATVRRPNSVYPVGTRLENQSAYFSAIAPVLDGNFTYGYTATDGGDLTVATNAELVLQSVRRDRGDQVESVYWRTSRDLGERRVAGVAPGETVRVPFSVNASALSNRSAEISKELGGSVGRTESLVRVTVALSGTVNGQQVQRTEEYVLPVDPGSVYTVSNPGTTTDEHASTRSVAVPNEAGALERFGGPALLVVALGGLVGFVYARSTGALEPTPAEREYLAYREARADFDEWINAISLPESARALPRARAASLGALVDFAIDTNESVLEDPDDGAYYVVHGGYLYVYDPPGAARGGAANGEATATSVTDAAPESTGTLSETPGSDAQAESEGAGTGR